MNFRFLQVLGTILAFVFEVVATCNQDNCLRAFEDKSATASSFCATWRGATTALPTYASGCSYLPSRISSACSCLATATSGSITGSITKSSSTTSSSTKSTSATSSSTTSSSTTSSPSTLSTSSSSTSSPSPSPTTCPAVSTVTFTTCPAASTVTLTSIVSIAGGASTVTDDTTQTDSYTSTATSYVTLPPVTVTVTSAPTTSLAGCQSLTTCSCGPSPTPIVNPSYENNQGANWTFTTSNPIDVDVGYGEDTNGIAPTQGAWYLIANIEETASTDERLQVSQVINLCSGEGAYTFSVDAILLSGEPSCYVVASAYQGTGPYPPGAGVESWSSAAVAVGSKWTTITFGVPYINPGLGSAWTILANIECFLDPGTGELYAAVGLDNWQVAYQSNCVATEVLVPPGDAPPNTGGSDNPNTAPGNASTSTTPSPTPSPTPTSSAAADDWTVPTPTPTSSAAEDDWNLPS
ncbi:hypothetical protein V8E51_007395 [Hyaloscypha variabilis]